MIAIIREIAWFINILIWDFNGAEQVVLIICVAHLAIDLGWWCPVTALLTVQCLSDRHLQHTDWTLSLTKCYKLSLNSCSSIAEPWRKIARGVERHSGPTNPSWESLDLLPLLWWVNQGPLAIKLRAERTFIPVAQGALKKSVWVWSMEHYV